MKGSDLWHPVVPWGQLFGDLLQMGWVQERLDRVSVYVTRKTSLPLLGELEQKPCESWPKYGALEEHKNIQMVPRLSLQLCTAEWQVQQKHVEFFTRAYCVPTLTPSWVLWARPELCLDSMGLRWLCQRAWPPLHSTPFPSMFFSFSLPSPPPLSNLASTHAEAGDWWGKREVKQLKMALCANCFVH